MSIRGTRVAVIGAGLSGLAAAWRLRAAGCAVRLLEARDEVGGRAAGQRIENFGVERSLQLLRSEDVHLPRFIRDVGASDELLPLRPVVVCQVRGSRAVGLSERSQGDVARIPGVRWSQALRLVRLPRLMRRYEALLDRDAPERAADWDYRSVADFARLYFGESVYQRWIGPLAASATLGDPQELSRVVFLLEWLRDQSSRRGLARRGLGELPTVAADRLGVDCGVCVDAVTAQAEGGYALRCRDGSSLGVDAVVVSTAGEEAARLAQSCLTRAERDFFAELRSGPEVVLAAALNRPATGVPQFVRVPAEEGDVLESLLVEPGVADGRAPLGSGIATLAARQSFSETSAGASDEVVEKEMIAAFERVFPSVVGTIRFTRVFRRDDGLPRFEVGAYRALASFRRVQRDRRSLGRRLYFAGDYLSGLSPDERVGSGNRAAGDLLGDLADA